MLKLVVQPAQVEFDIIARTANLFGKRKARADKRLESDANANR
jgi:hypothetical protein